jgi:tRNA threonylcarbamoyladenosine biosynthesis protein TsaE
VSATARSETDGPEATERAGAALAATLSPGDVVLVSGELGAGKTTFVRGALRQLGVTGPVTSPTFVVGHAYDGRDGPLAHLDLYRLAGMGDEDPGLLDPFFDPATIAFVEWPEQAAGAWPGERVAAHVRLEHAGGDRRRIAVQR